MAGAPEICMPNYEKLNLQMSKAAIEKTKIHLSFDEYNWWKGFFQTTEVRGTVRRSWPLQRIGKKHKVHSIPNDIPLTNPEDRSTCITAVLETEQTCREVLYDYVSLMVFFSINKIF